MQVGALMGTLGNESGFGHTWGLYAGVGEGKLHGEVSGEGTQLLKFLRVLTSIIIINIVFLEFQSHNIVK
jgi:hypothetical protein